MENNQILREYLSDVLECVVGENGELGCGSFGCVRLAFHHTVGPVAVKCFAVSGGKREKNMIEKKICNEMKSILCSNQGNIVRVYGWSKWPRSMGLVMEYLAGGNLKHLLLDPTPIPPELQLRIVHEIFSGVAFIHDLELHKNTVHGDLKPENILLTSDLHCKIADFGSANIASLTTTSTGNRVPQMTLIYSAPERLLDKFAKLTKEMDIYSCGMIIHMVVTQESPLTMSESQFLQAIKEGQRPEVSDLKYPRTEVTDLLISTMNKCWEDKPSKRPNASDVRSELQEADAKLNPTYVQKLVAVVLESYDVKTPAKSECECKPLTGYVTQTSCFDSVIPIPKTESAQEATKQQTSTMFVDEPPRRPDVEAEPFVEEDDIYADHPEPENKPEEKGPTYKQTSNNYGNVQTINISGGLFQNAEIGTRKEYHGCEFNEQGSSSSESF